MRTNTLFRIVIIVSAICFGCIAVAGGAMHGVCLRSILGGIICMAFQWVVVVVAAKALFPKHMNECETSENLKKKETKRYSEVEEAWQ